MDSHSRTILSSDPNTQSQTPFQNGTDHHHHHYHHVKQKSGKAMAKFQELILKLAQSSQPNAPLTPAARAHVQNLSTQFVSQYTTPDHPPYSAMIERALCMLNEKGGSKVESITRFLEEEYNHLPWAHSTLLKYHLGKLRESGDIVMPRANRYMLRRGRRDQSLL